MATKKQIEKYTKLPWTYTIEPEESYYIISVNELPGVCTDADSIEEGMVEIQDAIYAAIELYLDLGKEIPEPVDKSKFRGKIPYRTSPETHRRLVRTANIRHMSVNKLIDSFVEQGLRSNAS